jgi:hypothetical protein
MPSVTPADSFLGSLLGMSDSLGGFLHGMQSAPQEEVLLRYTKGTGRFSPDKRFISLSMFQYKFSGEQDGHHEGVWEALFSDPRELLNRPPEPTGAINLPQGPVPEVKLIAETKGIWVFGDDSSVTAAGPALSHLMPLKDGRFLFTVTTCQIITNGTGRYQGARGLKTSLGSTLASPDLFDPTKNVPFEATTVDTFRIIPSKDVKA